MEFVKKLLVLSMIPVSVLAMENEKKTEGSLLRKPLNYENLCLRSYHNDSPYHKKLVNAFNNAQIHTNLYKGYVLDVTDIENAITCEARKPFEQKIETLSNKLSETESRNIELNKKNIELHNNINHFKNHIPKVRARSFAFGALATCLYYIWYPLLIRAK